MLFALNLFSVFDPVVMAIAHVLVWLTGLTHNLAWSLILVAALIKLLLWPLTNTQYRSMMQMKEIQPKIQALQAKFKGDSKRIQQETMDLYKSQGVNPLAGCLPLVLQLPILFSVYGAITKQADLFAQTTWMWIGTPISHAYPHIFAQSLKDPDMALLLLYSISMFFSVRLNVSPSMDPAMQQQQQIMAYLYPVMFGVIGRSWPSALILYWLTFNIFSMAQQAFMMRKYATPGANQAVLSAVPSPPVETLNSPAKKLQARKKPKNNRR